MYITIQQKFKTQHTQLIAKHYITADLFNNPVIVNFDQELNILHLIFTDHEIKYYVRKSELFRDDLIHNAVALVKNITVLQAQFFEIDRATYKIVITLFFTQAQKVEIPCILTKNNAHIV